MPISKRHAQSRLPNLLTLMQRVQDAAIHEYRYYVTGEIDANKWNTFALKMAGRYETDLKPSSRSKRRKAGEAVCMLYGCDAPPHTPDAKCPWILVVTEGSGRVHGAEDLREFAKERMEINGFELVHDGKCWTWKMTADREGYWRKRIEQIAKLPPPRRRTHNDEQGDFDADIEAVMDSLYRQPGFRLVRRQVGKLVSFARDTWRRHRLLSGPPIRRREFLPYVQRLPNHKRETPREQ